MSASGRKIALAAIPICLTLAFWRVHPHLIFDTDSARYLAGSPMRTATYPVFLDLAFGPALLAIQLLLLAGALCWLAVYSLKFLPTIACAAMILSISANPYIWELQASVMSEALTTPILTLVVGCVLAFALTGGRSLIITSALLCGLATTVRPSLAPLILTPLCAVWVAPTLTRKIKLSAFLLLAWGTPVAAERLYSRAVHGPELTSPLGRQIFMKAAIIDASPTQFASTDPVDRRLLQALNQDFAPARAIVAKATDRGVRYTLLTNYEAFAGYPYATNIMESMHLGEADFHRHLLNVGLARLESNPWAYLELAATEYHRMWLLHQRKDPELASEYNAFLTREAPIPFQAQLGELAQPTPAGAQRPILHLQRMVFAAVGLLAALMTMGLAIRREGPLSQAAFALLLGSQAVLVFSAFLGVGLPRYAMGMWPTLIAGELLGIVGVFGFWARRLPIGRGSGGPEQYGGQE